MKDGEKWENLGSGFGGDRVKETVLGMLYFRYV